MAFFTFLMIFSFSNIGAVEVGDLSWQENPLIKTKKIESLYEVFLSNSKVQCLKYNEKEHCLKFAVRCRDSKKNYPYDCGLKFRKMAKDLNKCTKTQDSRICLNQAKLYGLRRVRKSKGAL